MPIPDFQTLMLPVLKLSSIEQVRTADIVKTISDQFNLTHEERETLLPSGRQTTISNRVHWAIAYLNKAGLIQRIQRGTYAATEAGRQVLSQSPEKIDIKYLHQFEKFREFQRTNRTKETFETPDASLETPEERIDEAADELNAALKVDILERVRTITPTAFEKLIIELMAAMGYGAKGTRTHMGKSGDGGVDGTITEDALGLDVIYMQAKRYAQGNNIGVEKIREFVGTLDERGATKGVFVTTSKFAAGALQYSSRSTKRVTLIDGDELANLMITYNVAVRTYRNVAIKKIDTDYFEEIES